jgi:hypothetical protein
LAKLWPFWHLLLAINRRLTVLTYVAIQKNI